MKATNKFSLVVLLLVAAASTGCSGVDPEVAKIRDAIFLSETPTDAVSIEDARSNIESKTDIVLMGRIGVKDLTEWWIDGSASFYISEGMDGSHYNAGPDHDPSSCPFCRRNWVLEDSMATIHLVDADGKRFSVNANRILDVKEGDLVALRGQAHLDERGVLTLNCNGLQIK